MGQAVDASLAAGTTMRGDHALVGAPISVNHFLIDQVGNDRAKPFLISLRYAVFAFEADRRVETVPPLGEKSCTVIGAPREGTALREDCHSTLMPPIGGGIIH
jgi:hypothetical protein